MKMSKKRCQKAPLSFHIHQLFEEANLVAQFFDTAVQHDERVLAHVLAELLVLHQGIIQFFFGLFQEWLGHTPPFILRQEIEKDGTTLEVDIVLARPRRSDDQVMYPLPACRRYFVDLPVRDIYLTLN
jgi:hypothetical protein